MKAWVFTQTLMLTSERLNVQTFERPNVYLPHIHSCKQLGDCFLVLSYFFMSLLSLNSAISSICRTMTATDLRNACF